VLVVCATASIVFRRRIGDSTTSKSKSRVKEETNGIGLGLAAKVQATRVIEDSEREFKSQDNRIIQRSLSDADDVSEKYVDDAADAFDGAPPFGSVAARVLTPGLRSLAFEAALSEESGGAGSDAVEEEEVGEG
jgi:hypothetical protein